MLSRQRHLVREYGRLPERSGKCQQSTSRPTLRTQEWLMQRQRQGPSRPKPESKYRAYVWGHFQRRVVRAHPV